MHVNRRSFYFLLSLLVILFVATNPALTQPVTLVKFGSSPSNTTFGLAGWNTILKSSNQIYTSQGNGGLIGSSDAGEFGDFRGIRGTSRKFNMGERIAVTWYNNSEEVFLFTARISFTDDDAPSDIAPEGFWYTMRSEADYRYTYSEILPHTTVKTVFNITDSGVHKTDGTYSKVNINLAIEWGSTYQKQFLICEKIELLNDADILPPSRPDGLAVHVISDSKIQLNWNPATDAIGVVEYLLYVNGIVEGYSRSNQYTCVFLEPNSEYVFSISALDAAGNESLQSNPLHASTLSYQGGVNLVNPAGLEYLGAFALPEQFSWGGEAVAYNCDGDPSAAGDGFPGSLFVTNLNQPENGLVGEITIPTPIVDVQKNIANLNQAAVLVQPVNIRPANVNSWDYVDIWRTGLEYVPEETRLYSSWSIHYTVGGEKHASISCCNASNLAGNTKYGAWHIGNSSQPPIDAMMNDWLFSMPQSWADENALGRSLVVGRCRDGGLSGLGPTLYAFSKVSATPPAANSELAFTTLLEYGSVEGTDNYHFPNSINGYNHADDWREAMWLSAGDQDAVAIVGNKALGFNWYGYHGEQMRHDWVIADVPYPEFYETDPDGKGWRSHNRQPMIIFFNPDDLTKVANSQLSSFDPQPYAAYRIPEEKFFGEGHEIFSATVDNQNNILYVTEFVREFEGGLIEHAWRINPVTTSVKEEIKPPQEFRLHQNYPNPFNPETTIRYSLPKASHVQVEIFDVLGRKIRILVDARKTAGHFQITWDGMNAQSEPVAAGVYFCRLSAGDFVKMIKLTLVK